MRADIEAEALRPHIPGQMNEPHTTGCAQSLDEMRRHRRLLLICITGNGQFGWSLGSVLVLFLLAMLANLRLHRIAEKRAVKLMTTEARYRELFENAASGILQSTLQGEILEANPAFAELLGWPDHQRFLDFAKQNNEAVLWVNAKQREEFVKLIQTKDRVDNYEVELRRLAGDTVWISQNVRVARDGAGKILFFESFVSDLTARRRLETEFVRASKLEAVGILAGGIAHDCNNTFFVRPCLYSPRPRRQD